MATVPPTRKLIARGVRAPHKGASKGGFMPKLSLSQAWDEARAILAHDGRLFGAVGLAMFVLPGLILNVSMPEAVAGEMPPAGPWLIVAVLAVLVSLVGQLATIRLAIGPHVTVGAAIMHGLKRLAPYVIAVLLWIVPILLIGSALYAILKLTADHPSVAVAIALIILTFVGFYLGVRLMLASAVASAENQGPFRILRRSWDLSLGNWWRLFAFLLLFALGALCLLWAVESVFGVLAKVMFGDVAPLTLGGLLVAIVTQLVSAIVSVIFFVILARIYVQRAGGSDVQASLPSSGI